MCPRLCSRTSCLAPIERRSIGSTAPIAQSEAEDVAHRALSLWVQHGACRIECRVESFEICCVTKHPGAAVLNRASARLKTLNIFIGATGLVNEAALMRGHQDGVVAPCIVRQAGGANSELWHRLFRPASHQQGTPQHGVDCRLGISVELQCAPHHLHGLIRMSSLRASLQVTRSLMPAVRSPSAPYAR
jgi:hypothetical protein